MHASFNNVGHKMFPLAQKKKKKRQEKQKYYVWFEGQGEADCAEGSIKSFFSQ